MISLPLNIPQSDTEVKADFSQPSTTVESLAASYVLGFKGSTFGKVQEYVKTQYETIGDDSPVLSPDDLNKKFPEMATPFNTPTSLRKAEILANGARKQRELQRTADNHRESTVLEIGKFGAQFGANIVDPIGVATGMSVGAGITRVLAKTAFGIKAANAAATYTRTASVARNMAEGVTGNLLEEALISAPLSAEAQEDYDAYQSVAFAVGAGIAMPAVVGAMSKTFSLFKKSPELADKAMHLAQVQAENGKAINLEAVERQAMVKELPRLQEELDNIYNKEAKAPGDLLRTQEIIKEMEEIKNLKPLDNAEVTKRANSMDEDAFHRPEFKKLTIVDDEPDMFDSDTSFFKDSVNERLEDVKRAFNLEELDPIVANGRKMVEDLDLHDEAIKQVIACERKA